MELVKPVEPVLWASIVELVIGGTGYGTVEALVPISAMGQLSNNPMAHNGNGHTVHRVND